MRAIHNRRLELLEMLIIGGADLNQSGALQAKPTGHTKIETEISQILADAHQQAGSLKHLCRLRVRATCSTRGKLRVSKLNGVLPSALVNYLILSDIDAIELKYCIHC